MFAVENQRPGRIDYEVVALWLGSLLFLAAFTYPFWSPFYSSVCPMKTLAGIPCALCGGTRASYALTHFDFGEALSLNPLAALGGLAFSGYWTYSLGCVAMRRDRRIRFVGLQPDAAPHLRNSIVGAIAAVVVLNWTYLIWVGR